MQGISTNWALSNVHHDDQALDTLIGAKLRLMWASIPLEPVPREILLATVALFGKIHPVFVERHQSYFLFRVMSLIYGSSEKLRESREKRARNASRKMIERAIRENGIAWLASEDVDF